jgi:hypothetical protein
VFWNGANGWMVSKGRNASEQGPDRSGGYAVILTFHSARETSFDLTVYTGFLKYYSSHFIGLRNPSVPKLLVDSIQSGNFF